MNDILIANIAQLKQAEINALSRSVAQLQNEIVARQVVIDSLQARNDLCQEQLAEADTRRSNTLATLNHAQATHSAAHALRSACDTATRHAEAVNTTLSQMAGKKAALLRQLVCIAALLEKAGQLANKQKSNNPQIPDVLLKLLAQASEACANVVALALTAQNACLLTSGGMATTLGSLTLARDEASQLQYQLGQREEGVLQQLSALYQSAAEHYNHILDINSNATSQVDHAQGALAAVKSRLASQQAGLAVMGG